VLVSLLISWSNNDRPLQYSIFKDKSLIRSVDLWKAGSSKKIIEVINSEQQLLKLIKSVNEIVIVNYKKFVDYFGIIDSVNIYDYPGEINDHQEFINENFDEFKKEWQVLRYKASNTYHNLEKRGVFLEHKLMKLKYNMDTFSGRSNSVGFNVQGCNKEFNIRHHNYRNNIFIHFDWIAADHRIASIMSGDKDLISCYENSDPYTHIVNILDGQVERDQCKSEFMQAVYGLNPNHEILTVFPEFREWISSKVDDLNKDGYVRSILGRKYVTDKSIKGNRRAFNSIMQGSVAHAMNNTIHKVEKELGDIILTEQHDSLTVCVNEFIAFNAIKTISDIMIRPLEGILPYDFTMPLKIHVGKKWREYKQVKEVR